MKAKINNYNAWIEEVRPDILHAYYKKLLLDCGFKIVSEQVHFFEPFGFTCLFLLTESHFAIHTFPEENKTYIELSSCIDDPFNKFLQQHDKQKTFDYTL